MAGGEEEPPRKTCQVVAREGVVCCSCASLPRPPATAACAAFLSTFPPLLLAPLPRSPPCSLPCRPPPAVRFALDRAGLVGADGATHCGAFDTTYMACLPNMVVMAPSNEAELINMVATCAAIDDR